MVGALLIMVSMFSGKVAKRFGLSHLLVTLLIGILLGNGGKYDINYNNPVFTLHISELALAFIIFGGGYNTHIKKFKTYITRGLALSTIGVLVTTAIMGLFVWWLEEWNIIYALLLGAIVSSTDAAAVFSILENTGLKLRNGIQETLELESGTNDPMAYMLTVGLSTLIVQPDLGASFLVISLVKSIAIGTFTGLAFGKLLAWVISKAQLKNGQNPILIVCFVIFLYAFNTEWGGSAFLSLYLAGVWVGNAMLPNKKFNTNFQESISWMMESVLFLILGLQVYINDLAGVFWQGIIVSALLMFVARPVSVMLCTAFVKDFNWRDRLFVSWVGLRGATPIVFALVPVVMQIPGIERLFNLSFIVVVVSVIFQGASLAPLARLLGLDTKRVKA